MGLFDRFKAPRTQEDAPVASGVPEAPAAPAHHVPDIDDEPGPFSDSVREHLERLTAAADADIASLDPGAFDAALTSRLVSAERIHSTGLGFTYASRFADHVHEVLTLDLPSAVVTLPDSRVAESGRRLPSLINRGRTNLLELLETAPVDVDRVTEGRRGLWTVIGDTPYTASFARFLNDAAHRWLPDVDDRNGWVFALPYRHAILLQPCGTAAEVRDALELVPDWAQRMHADGISPLSKHTYHWVDRQITCLTTENEDGTMSVRPSEMLEQVLGLGRRAG
ncbi:hypothetical protein [Oryzobacter telluris]|uniref:hypothetical protein n=1 Tax=Oryzobacter telluris TaxID=3149179 RepID=UPI00370DC1E4